MASLFCYNCGTKLEVGAQFCEACGVKVCDDVQSGGATNSHFLSNEEEHNSASSVMVGIIFTDTERLAQRFGVEGAVVEDILKQYIVALRGYGVEYSLLDVSNYSFKNPSKRGVKFNVESTSLDYDAYIAVLADTYNYGFDKQQKPSTLFIIGDGQIIPMYRGENYLYTPVNGFSDADIDSDLPYSYILEGRSDELMRELDIICYPYLLYVGRLPFGLDSTFEVLVSYLQRNISAMRRDGVVVSQAYAQIDPHWSIEAAEVSKALNNRGMLTPKSGDEDYTYNNIYTTPNVLLDNIDKYFDTSVDMLYFNMHGSNAPRSPYFLGVRLGDENNIGIPGVSPVQLVHLTRANVVVTEACYGARFERLNRMQSMLLSALSANTLVYMGSSRIAVAGSITRVEDSHMITCADVIAKLFIEELLAGNMSGAAFYRARQGYIQRLNGQISLQDKLTIAEFNLFGDPTVLVCSTKGAHRIKDYLPLASQKPLCDGGDKVESSSEYVYTLDHSSSLLSMIRGAVDKNIKEVRETINRYMCVEYGLDSSSLKSIRKEKFRGENSASLTFMYAVKSGEIDKFYFTRTSEDGVVKSVTISK